MLTPAPGSGNMRRAVVRHRQQGRTVTGMSNDRSLTLSPDARTLWVHWGRTGGGPRFLADLVDGDLAAGDLPTRTDNAYLSWNPDAEIAPRLAETGTRCAGDFPVRTYTSTLGVILGVPRLVWNSLRVRRWLRTQKIDRVVCVMESVYQSLALPVLTPRDVEYVACIHDATIHPGEENILQILGKRNELRRADRIVTFSDAVTRALSGRVDVPVATGSHPPFDLQDAATDPRELPDLPVIGLFGRLQQYKGIDIALAAAKILRDRGVPPFELRITGSGPEERLRETDLGSQAVWDTRWIPEEEVTDIVRGMDIMLLPYTEASQSGPVTLAMAHAVPCVGTPVGAIPEQLEGFGAVSADTTPESVADALEPLITDPDLYRELSAGAVRRVAEQPDWSDLATLVRTGETSSSTSSGTTSPVSRLKWLGQRVFGQLNVHMPLPAAPSSGAGRTRVILPAPHGSFGDEAMGIVAARKYPDADLVVPGDPAPWRSLLPDPVGVLALGDLTVGPGMTPTRRTVDALADGPVVVIGADTLAGDYELSLLATRVRLLNVAVAAGHPASLVNFSLPETVHPDARRILRRLDAGVTVRARDAVSARRAQDVFGREVSCVPDIAAELEPAGEVGEGSPVVFVPNAHLGGMYGVTTEQLVDLWRNTGVQLGQPVEVVIHDIREEVGDLELGRRIAAALEESGIPASVTVLATAAEAKGAISGARVCISARMHACVAALSSGVPTVGIGYVGKFSGQFAWYGDLGAVVEYRPDLTAEEIVDLVAQEDRAA